MLRIGGHNVVRGTATANRMFFGTASQVDVCTFNANVGGNANAACGNIQQGVSLPITAWPPLPVPAVVPGNSNFTCAAFQTCTLAAGAYRDIVAKDNSVINLDPGVTYQARNLFVENGATLNGSGSSINLTQTFNTEPNAQINDVTITSIKSGTAEVIEVGNNSTIINSVLYAPFARAHLHQALVTQATEVVAVLIVVEPVKIPEIHVDGCACIGNIAKGQGTIALSNGCGLNIPSNQYFVATTCAIACPGAGCTSAALGPPAPTNSSATISIPGGVGAGDYHVIVVSPFGQFCTAGTVPLP